MGKKKFENLFRLRDYQRVGNHSLEQFMKNNSEFPLLLKTGTEFLWQICLQLLAEGSCYISARLKSCLLNVSSPVDTFKL